MAAVVKKTAKRSKQASRSRRSTTKHIATLRLAFGSFSIAFSFETTHTPPKAKAKPKVKTKKSTSRRQWVPYTLITAGIVGMVLAGYSLLQTTSHTSTPARYPIVKELPPVETGPTMPMSNGVQLRVPSIEVDAPITLVGKAADGTVEVPGKPDVVGQYKLAPTPGEKGPAVIVGHVDSLFGTAVFWRLRELTPGQSIEVQREDGTVAYFTVESIQEFDQAQFPTQQVYGNIDYAGLRLITCSGSFNLLSRSYEKNIVVFARLNK